jgi:hypothetical protein
MRKLILAAAIAQSPIAAHPASAYCDTPEQQIQPLCKLECMTDDEREEFCTL